MTSQEHNDIDAKVCFCYNYGENKMSQKNIIEYIRALDHIKIFLQSLLEEENKNIPEGKDHLAEITELRMLSKTKDWPEALQEDLICEDKESDKLLRAEDVLQNLILTSIEGKSILDFGCGEGHVPFLASKNGIKKVVGYDIKDQDWNHFEKKENFILTSDWDFVVENGPYDIILVNDVLDHTKDPFKELIRIRNVKAPQIGKIFLRLHPWTSRHGTHLYRQLNKAYLHLVFTTEELYSMGFEGIPTLEFTNPLQEYKKIINDIGLTIVSENIIKQPIEIFFTHKKEILRRIKSRWKENIDNSFPRDILEIQFIDFTLI